MAINIQENFIPNLNRTRTNSIIGQIDRLKEGLAQMIQKEQRNLFQSDDSKDTPFESFYNPQISILNSPSVDFPTEFSDLELISQVEPSEIMFRNKNRYDFVFQRLEQQAMALEDFRSHQQRDNSTQKQLVVQLQIDKIELELQLYNKDMEIQRLNQLVNEYNEKQQFVLELADDQNLQPSSLEISLQDYQISEFENSKSSMSLTDRIQQINLQLSSEENKSSLYRLQSQLQNLRFKQVMRETNVNTIQAQQKLKQIHKVVTQKGQQKPPMKPLAQSNQPNLNYIQKQTDLQVKEKQIIQKQEIIDQERKRLSRIINQISLKEREWSRMWGKNIQQRQLHSQLRKEHEQYLNDQKLMDLEKSSLIQERLQIQEEKIALQEYKQMYQQKAKEWEKNNQKALKLQQKLKAIISRITNKINN